MGRVKIINRMSSLGVFRFALPDLHYAHLLEYMRKEFHLCDDEAIEDMTCSIDIVFSHYLRMKTMDYVDMKIGDILNEEYGISNQEIIICVNIMFRLGLLELVITENRDEKEKIYLIKDSAEEQENKHEYLYINNPDILLGKQIMELH